MKNCSFSISINQSAEEVVRLASSAITGAGGEFSGDQTTGEFRLSTGIGAVRGSYTISPGSLNVTVTDKPVLIGCGRIENEIKKYLHR